MSKTSKILLIYTIHTINYFTLVNYLSFFVLLHKYLYTAFSLYLNAQKLGSKKTLTLHRGILLCDLLNQVYLFQCYDQTLAWNCMIKKVSLCVPGFIQSG